MLTTHYASRPVLPRIQSLAKGPDGRRPEVGSTSTQHPHSNEPDLAGIRNPWFAARGMLDSRGLLEALDKNLQNDRPPNVPLLRALWSLLDAILGLLKGSWGVLDDTAI